MSLPYTYEQECSDGMLVYLAHHLDLAHEAAYHAQAAEDEEGYEVPWQSVSPDMPLLLEQQEQFLDRLGGHARMYFNTLDLPFEPNDPDTWWVTILAVDCGGQRFRLYGHHPLPDRKPIIRATSKGFADTVLSLLRSTFSGVAIHYSKGSGEA